VSTASLLELKIETTTLATTKELRKYIIKVPLLSSML
jgi:hypothetical protein